jgi:tetratricopeptide (TPR) repeat protein
MIEAISTLERALEIDPKNAFVMALGAYYCAQCQFQGWSRDSAGLAETALKLAWEAVSIDGQDANVQWLAAFAIWTFSRDAERSRELFKRSLSINPNNALAYTLGAWVETAIGNSQAGRSMIEHALRLNPRHPRGWIMSAGMAISYIAEKRFDEAIPWGEKALVQNPRSAVSLRALAVALAHAGQRARAGQIVDELLRTEPGLTVSALPKRLPFTKPGMMTIYIDGLRAAGLPE